MLLLDEQGLKRLIDNINKDVNTKVSSIQNRNSYIKEVVNWVQGEGIFKSVITHPLNSDAIDVTAMNKATGDRVFIHDRVIDSSTIEISSETNEALVVLIMNGKSGITEIDIPMNDNATSTLETWSSKKIQEELDKKSTDAISTSFDNSINGMTATNVQAAIDELFQNVANGKTLVASATSDKGILTLATDTFFTMSNNIRMIPIKEITTPTYEIGIGKIKATIDTQGFFNEFKIGTGSYYSANNIFDNLNPVAQYTFYAKKDGFVTSKSFTTPKANQTIPASPSHSGLTYESITITAPSGSKIRHNGVDYTSPKTFTGLSPETDYTFYSVTSSTSTLNESVSSGLTVKTKAYPAYGVRLYKNTSSPILERVGDAIGLVANAGIGANAVQNNFDNIYPWSHRKRCNLSPTGVVNAYEGEPTFKLDGTNGEVMVETPKFYQKYVETSDYIEWWVSQFNISGFRLSERFKTKTSTLDKIYTGAYEAGYVNSKLTSRTGVSPAVSMGRDIARDRAKAISTDWGIIDIAYRCDILFYLFVVEFATLNSQSIAAGLTTLGAATNTGQADTVAATTGSKTNATDGKSAFKYRGEENPWGNIWEWVDGCNIINRKAYAHYIPQEYADDKFTTPYVATAYTNASSNGFTKTIGNDNNVPYISLPINSMGSDSTYYCDNYYQDTGNIAPVVGGSWGSASSAGLVYWSCDARFSVSTSAIGTRLSYKPS